MIAKIEMTPMATPQNRKSIQNLHTKIELFNSKQCMTEQKNMLTGDIQCNMMASLGKIVWIILQQSTMSVHVG